MSRWQSMNEPEPHVDTPDRVGTPERGASSRTRPARAETRRRVLDAALTVFGERGIAGSSLTEVAGEAALPVWMWVGSRE